MGWAEGGWICAFNREQRWHNQHRYALFITSLTDIQRFSCAIRKHWAIENQLHRSLDVICCEDASKVGKDMSPLNLNVLRETALALCKHADFGRKVSLQKKRFAAALDPDCFLQILFAKL